MERGTHREEQDAGERSPSVSGDGEESGRGPILGLGWAGLVAGVPSTIPKVCLFNTP